MCEIFKGGDSSEDVSNQGDKGLFIDDFQNPCRNVGAWQC